MINAGKLRHRVRIEKPVYTQNQNNGAVEPTWEEVATVWSEISALSAKEFIAAQAEDSKVTTRITIRYRSDIDHSYRLYHAAKDKYYNIEGVLADKDSGLEYIVLPCSEGIRYTEGELSVPDNLVAPEIIGNAIIGQVVSATEGVWANEPAGYGYQWYLNDLPIVGAVSENYLIDAALNDILTVGVIASNAAGAGIESISAGKIVS